MRGSDDSQAPFWQVARAAAPQPALDRWTLFHEAIANLPAENRATFELVWYPGADQRTVARLLDCSERKVRDRWRAGRRNRPRTLPRSPGARPWPRPPSPSAA